MAAGSINFIVTLILLYLGYAIGIAILFVIAYFVIKKAVKAALREWDQERRGDGFDGC